MSGHDILDRRVFPPGEIIFKEGETGRRCAYLVESGKVEITKSVPGGGEPQVLGHISAGGIFGEMALVDNKPRMAQAKTVALATAVALLAEVDDPVAAHARGEGGGIAAGVRSRRRRAARAGARCCEGAADRSARGQRQSDLGQ